MKIITRALTVAEYRAKAALLGMWYGDKTNGFVHRPKDNGPYTFFDADTGEEIDNDEVRRRMKAFTKEHGNPKKGGYASDF